MTQLTNTMNIISKFNLSIVTIFLIFSLKCIAFETSNNTTFSFPKNISNELAIESILPARFGIIGTTQGDLNKDDLMDIAVIVGDTSETVEFEAPVYLGIYFKNSNGSYDLNVVSSTAILCFKCGGVMGNPFAGIEITKKGILQIHHYGGSVERWGYVDKYRFQNGAFYLIGHTYIESSPDAPNSKSTDYNLITGDKEILLDPNIESKKEKIKKSRSKVTVKPLKTIDTYSPGNL